MVIVVICNAFKVVCFLYAVRTSGFEPLITLGDSIASFLDRPDSHTHDLGAVSAADVRAAQERAVVRRIQRRRQQKYSRLEDAAEERADPVPNLPLQLGAWRGRPQRWFAGASRLRWGLTYAL